MAEVAMNGWIRMRLVADATRNLKLAPWMALGTLLLSAGAAADEARWIWSPEQPKENVPAGAICHFRKAISVRNPEGGQISITADDQYDLYVNGRRVGTGEATRKLDEYDISRQLV